MGVGSLCWSSCLCGVCFVRARVCLSVLCSVPGVVRFRDVPLQVVSLLFCCCCCSSRFLHVPLLPHPPTCDLVIFLVLGALVLRRF